MYLARYDNSPAGKFDEMVALAGLVWNPPTSCAWAARVYVDSAEARNHGVRAVGLPSRLASFSAGDASTSGEAPPRRTGLSWWGAHYRPRGYRSPAAAEGPACPVWPRGGGARAPVLTTRGPAGPVPVCREDGGAVVLSNTERGALGLQGPVARMEVPDARPWWQWAGPRVTLSLPSFSGRTPAVPGALKYSCRVSCNLRLAKKMAVRAPGPTEGDKRKAAGPGGESLAGILNGKALLCLAFDNMRMEVDEPVAMLDRGAAATAEKALSLATVASRGWH